MKKIKITIFDKVSLIAELDDKKCPVVVDSFLKMLPINVDVHHGIWSGSEIWAELKNFSKYAHENETHLPGIGEIMIVQHSGKTFFDLWYGKGLACTDKGTVNGAIIGKAIENLDNFAKEAAKICPAGGVNLSISLLDNY